MLLTLYIQPGAKKTELSGLHDSHHKLRVAAPPVEGAANKELLRFIAEHLGLPKTALKLVAGEKSRLKTLEFDEKLMKKPGNRLW